MIIRKIKQMIEKYYRWKAKRKLISQYRYITEVDKILEDYISHTVMKGGSDEFLAKSRADLVTKRSAIKTQEAFIAFLQNI